MALHSLYSAGGRFKYQGASIKVDLCCWYCRFSSMDVLLFRSWSSVLGHWLSFVSLSKWDVGLQLIVSTSGDPIIQEVVFCSFLIGWLSPHHVNIGFKLKICLFYLRMSGVIVLPCQNFPFWGSKVCLWTVWGSYRPKTWALGGLLTPNSRVICSHFLLVVCRIKQEFIGRWIDLGSSGQEWPTLYSSSALKPFIFQVLGHGF